MKKYNHDFFNTDKTHAEKNKVEQTDFPQFSEVAKRIDVIGRKHHDCSVVKAINKLFQEEPF